MVLGIGMFLPWMSVQTGIDFFSLKFPQDQPSFDYPLAISSTGFLIAIGMVLYGDYISITTRIVFSYSACIVILVLLPIEAQAFQGNQSGYNISIFMVVILGIFYTSLKGSVYGLGGILPSVYMNAIMNGNGISGLIISFVRIIILICLPPGSGNNMNEENLAIGTLLYFIVGGTILALCIVLVLVLVRMPFTLHYFKIAELGKKKKRKKSESFVITQMEIDSIPNEDVSKNGNYLKTINEESSERIILNYSTDNVEASTPLTDPSITTFNEEESKYSALIATRESIKVILDPTYKEIITKLWLLILLAMTTIIVTTFSYPGIAMHTNLTFIASKSWFTVFITSNYYIFNTLGRFAVHRFSRFTMLWAIMCVAIRLPLMITFIAIAEEWAPAWLFGSNWFKILNLEFFAFTDGYAVTFLMVFAPKLVAAKGKQKASFFMTFGILFGAFIGAMISDFGIKGILT